MLRRWVTSQKDEIPNHTAVKVPKLASHLNAEMFTSFYLVNITFTEACSSDIVRNTVSDSH
jgi:hypothetical protein